MCLVCVKVELERYSSSWLSRLLDRWQTNVALPSVWQFGIGGAGFTGGRHTHTGAQRVASRPGGDRMSERSQLHRWSRAPHTYRRDFVATGLPHQVPPPPAVHIMGTPSLDELWERAPVQMGGRVIPGDQCRWPLSESAWERGSLEVHSKPGEANSEATFKPTTSDLWRDVLLSSVLPDIPDPRDILVVTVPRTIRTRIWRQFDLLSR